MSRPATSYPELDAYLHLMGKVPDEEIASMAGVSASKVARARRRLNIKLTYAAAAATAAEASASAEVAPVAPVAPVVEVAPEPAAVAPAEEAPAEKPASDRKSKLAPFVDIIGVVPDREVAERASATVEAVRAYRKRHNIAAPPAASAAVEAAPAVVAAAVEAAPAVEAEAAAAPARAPRGEGKPGRRQSKLDPFLDLVGKLPDAEVAVQAGVTPENVRAFRNRHGIAAYYRLPTVEGEPPAPPRRGRPPKARPVAAPAAPAAAPVAPPESPKLTGGVEAWALKSSSGRRYVILGAGFAAAAVEAVARLASADPGASVLSLERVGVALA